MVRKGHHTAWMCSWMTTDKGSSYLSLSLFPSAYFLKNKGLHFEEQQIICVVKWPTVGFNIRKSPLHDLFSTLFIISIEAVHHQNCLRVIFYVAVIYKLFTHHKKHKDPHTYSRAIILHCEDGKPTCPSLWKIGRASCRERV